MYIVTKKLLEYGEYSELNQVDDFEELESTEWTTDYLCKIADKYCIVRVEHNQAGDADYCSRSKWFNSKED